MNDRQEEKRGGGDRGRRLSPEERSEIRARIAAGETRWEVAEAIDCSTKTVQLLLVRRGGLPSRARSRSLLRLSLAEREEMSRGLPAGESCRAIARRLGRAPSTVSREVAAHSSRQGYRAWRADEQAVRAARRPKTLSTAVTKELRLSHARRACLGYESRKEGPLELCGEAERGWNRINWKAAKKTHLIQGER